MNDIKMHIKSEKRAADAPSASQTTVYFHRAGCSFNYRPGLTLLVAWKRVIDKRPRLFVAPGNPLIDSELFDSRLCTSDLSLKVTLCLSVCRRVFFFFV